jgi:quaternary ammonium compound-resistance protein SugE
MNWIILIVAGLFEVAFASCLEKAKVSHGTAVLPIGTAYAVWTGIGAVGTVLVGVFVFKDPMTFWKLFFITTLIGSIIGLKAITH